MNKFDELCKAAMLCQQDINANYQRCNQFAARIISCFNAYYGNPPGTVWTDGDADEHKPFTSMLALSPRGWWQTGLVLSLPSGDKAVPSTIFKYIFEFLPLETAVYKVRLRGWGQEFAVALSESEPFNELCDSVTRYTIDWLSNRKNRVPSNYKTSSIGFHLGKTEL